MFGAGMMTTVNERLLEWGLSQHTANTLDGVVVMVFLILLFLIINVALCPSEMLHLL